MPPTTAALISCADVTPVPDGSSILPDFTPSHPCELQNEEAHVDLCWVIAGPDLSYPCFRTESVHETLLGEGRGRHLIQRDHTVSAGCWHATTSFARSLRVCDSESGTVTVLAGDVKGLPVPSPDGAAFALVDADPGSYGLKPHIYRVGADGTDFVRLDTRTFPQDRVVGAQILEWSSDGGWLVISLWGGKEGVYHRYRLSTDGTGRFEVAP